MAEELVPKDAFALRDGQGSWHIGAAERWSDGRLVGLRTYCGRNYPDGVERGELDGLTDVCSDCRAQVAQRH